MIILSFCEKCLTRYQILVEPHEARLVKQLADETGLTAPCPRLCGGKIGLVGGSVLPENSNLLRDPIKLTATEFYRAVHGAGLPQEIPNSKEAVDALLMAYAVKGSVLEERDGNVYLHELKLANGVTLHLTAGLYGAQVLKMTKEAPSGSGNPG